MKKILILLVVLLLSTSFGCNSYSSEINNEYEITEEEKSVLREKALNLVRSRTYCRLNNIVDEYEENEIYCLLIRTAEGEEFNIKFDLSKKDANGDYRMFSD